MPCLSVSEPSLITLHHEMGHIHYYLSYKNQSYIYQYAANPGFQEGIGDVITLSLLVPSHLKELGLLDQLHDDKGNLRAFTGKPNTFALFVLYWHLFLKDIYGILSSCISVSSILIARVKVIAFIKFEERSNYKLHK